jgi:hypothetical protein
MKIAYRGWLVCLGYAALLGLQGCVATGDALRSALGKDCLRQHEVKTSSKSVDFAPGMGWKTCSGYELHFQADGNLALYNSKHVAVWNSATAGKGATSLSLQPDGNLVIYANGRPLWNSGTQGNPGATLRVQEDGNVVIYSVYGAPLWQTATVGR